MTLVIITGGIDLSVASLLALVSVTIGFSSATGLPLVLALILGLLVGLFGGLLNGFIIAGLNLHPLVVTLGTMAFFRGLAYAVTNANAVSTFPDWFGLIGQAYLWRPGALPADRLAGCRVRSLGFFSAGPALDGTFMVSGLMSERRCFPASTLSK